MKKRPIYVIDTNILLDYGEIIPPPDKSNVEIREPTIDLKGAHLVIPSAVVRELSSFKKEKSDRGRSAREALRRLRALVEEQQTNMAWSYGLENAIWIPETGQKISILPINCNFKKSLPFAPSESDMDGQIILTTLSAIFKELEIPTDGSAKKERVLVAECDNVTLLTNDNGLAIRARQRGIKTSRYGYKYPEPYTGRRDIAVPRELLAEFFAAKRVSRMYFEEMMPDQPRLVANEFIVMRVEGDEYPGLYVPEFDPYFAYIGRYDAEEDAIVTLKYASSFPVQPRNPGQAIYAEALMNPDFSAIICTGPAGCGKTFMATVYGYNACKDGEFIGVTVIPCESQSKIGALPGDLGEKMDPEVQPLKNALRNYLLISDSKLKKELEALKKFGQEVKAAENKGASKKCSCENGQDEDVQNKRSIKSKLKDRVDLIWENWFSSIPIENARGRDFAYELAIYDEFQDQNVSQADTLIKRLGTDGKIILTGDIEQIHAPYLDRTNNGLVYASRLLYDNPMVAQVCFTEEEIIRHPLVKIVATRQKDAHAKKEP